MNLDSIVISLLDSDAQKGVFKKELGKCLNLPLISISEVWLETELVDGMIIQELWVSFIDARIPKEKLMKLPFKYICDNCIVFEVGDSII